MKPLYLVVSGGDCENEDDLVNVKRRRILPSMMSWYMSNMEKHELATKCISTGCLAMFGDICAQGIGQYLANGNPFANKLDNLRMIAMFADGTLCTGPLLHYAYELVRVLDVLIEFKMIRIDAVLSVTHTNTLLT